jgi:hypothetical protein
MSEISIECNVSDFAVCPPEEYDIVVFYLNEKCVVISFMDKNENVLTQTEIEKKEQSNIYRLEQKFGDTIESLVEVEKQKLLKSLNVSVATGMALYEACRQRPTV